jgi:hypothetical protein
VWQEAATVRSSPQCQKRQSRIFDAERKRKHVAVQKGL